MNRISYARHQFPPAIIRHSVWLEPRIVDAPCLASSCRDNAPHRPGQERGLSPEHVVFATAYLDRRDAAFKKTVDSLAWGSFVWFASEPEHLVGFYEGHPKVVKTLAEWN